MKKSILELYRFIFVLLIMLHHVQHLLGAAPEHYLDEGWIFVEFFFILTGILTTAHFARRTTVPSTVGGSSEAACELKGLITYMFVKFARLLPYVALAVTSEYVIRLCNHAYSKKELLSLMERYVMELLLLTSSGLATPTVGSLWYLSALMLVFPVFCIILSYPKSRNIWMVIGWSVALWFYGRVGLEGQTETPYNLLRAFMCLSMGASVYLIANKVSRYEVKKITRVMLTILEEGSFLLAIVLTLAENGNKPFIFICFIVGLTCVFSGKTYSSEISNKFLNYLGELSMVLYVLHWPIITFLNSYYGGLDIYIRTILFVGSSVVISVVALILVKKSGFNQKMKGLIGNA